MTEIYDYLRVLYARVGKGHCPQCGRPITAQSREQIIERIAALPAGTRFSLLAPLIRRQKGHYRDLFEDLLKQGFVRARVDGRVVHLSDDLQLDRQMRHDIDVVVDRLVAGAKIRPRLAEAVESALRLGNGNLIVLTERKRKAEVGSRKDGRAKPTAAVARAEGGRKRAAKQAPMPAFRLPPSAIPDLPLISFRPLCLHALRVEFRAAQPAVVQLQQPAGDVPRVQRPGADLHVRSGAVDPRPDAARFSRGASSCSGRGATWGAGGGTSSAAWRNSSSASTAWSPAACWRRPGKNSIPRSRMPCSGAPAASTSPSPGGAARRATNGAAPSRASSPSCSPSIAPRGAACSAASWKSTCASSAASAAAASGSMPRPPP